MAQPVWVLSVDLQTKTATFQTGMSEAAKSARSSFSEIKQGADEMGRSTSGSMMEARHGVMLLGEEFGVRLPRALTTFIASIGPIGAAMEAAFPFLAIIVGATLLLEHLAKLKQAGEALSESQTNFGTVAANVLNSWKDKILEAGIETDKLNHDHLGALNATLELIDHQSMKELAQSFDTVAKAADSTFAQLKTSWYQWDAGSAGAKASLEQFKVAYDALLAKQDSKGATALLDAKIEREQRILALQQQAQANQTRTGTQGTQHGDYAKFEEAKIALQKMGVGYAEDEVKAQVIQVGALKDLVDLEALRAELLKKQGDNAKQTAQNAINADSDKAARAQAQAQKQAADDAQKVWEENYNRAVEALQENERLKIDATKEGSVARLSAINAAIKEEESKGLEENGFYRGLLTSRVNLIRQMAEEQAKVQVEAAEQEHQAAEHANEEAAKDAEARRKISQIQTGSLAYLISKQKEQEQISAILQREQTDLTAAHQKEIAEQQSYISQMNQLAVNSSGETQVKAKEQAAQAQDRLTASVREYNAEMARTSAAIQDSEQQTAKLDNSWRMFFAEANHNALTLASTIRGQLQTSMQQATNAFSQGIAQSLVAGKSFGKEMLNAGREVSESLIEGLVRWGIQDMVTKMGMKATAASLAGANATASMAAAPWPVDMGAPAFGASMLGAAMAFETGGIVPGVTRGDSVPAMLTPGEAVLPKRMTERLTQASGDSANGGTHFHTTYSPTQHINVLDSEGVNKVLTEHAETFHKHFEQHVRKMNH